MVNGARQAHEFDIDVATQNFPAKTELLLKK